MLSVHRPVDQIKLGLATGDAGGLLGTGCRYRCRREPIDLSAQPETLLWAVDPPPYWVLPGPDTQAGRRTCGIFLVRGIATDTRNTRVCTCAAHEGPQRTHNAIGPTRRPRFAGASGYIAL